MATSWSLFQTKKGNKKHENNHGKQSPVRFRVILDINWLLCEEFKMHPHFWYESIRSAMTPWNCVQLLFVFLQAGAVICKKEILVKGVNGGFCYLTYLNNKIISLFIDISFALLSGDAVNCYTYNYEDFLFCSWNSSTADSTTDVTVKW